MFRLLFWIAVIAAAVWLWRRFKRPTPPSATTTAQPDTEPAPMVRCAQCGVHVPRDKALPQGTQWFCSQAHLEQGSPRQ
jgi:uncharacterized protein